MAGPCLPFLSHEKIRVCDIMWKTIKIPKETCVMYKKGMFLLLVSFIFFSLSTNVSASVDDYIRGYAEAVLEREFGIHPDSLTVNGGVITVGFQNMHQGRSACRVHEPRKAGLQTPYCFS
jgi:hypothetical protein